MNAAQTPITQRIAARLYRARSTVARSLLDLESATGVPLFERPPAGMRMMVYCEAFAARAPQAGC